MSHYVYILYSQKHLRTYVGQTDDVNRRLRQHNKGKVKSTKTYVPWTLIHVEIFKTRSEAMKKESWYKNPMGRSRIKLLLGEKGVNNS